MKLDYLLNRIRKRASFELGKEVEKDVFRLVIIIIIIDIVIIIVLYLIFIIIVVVIFIV